MDATATDVPVARALRTTARTERSVRETKRLQVDRATVWTLVLGLLATAGLALSARSVRDHNERVLLRQRTREAGAVITALIPNVQLPLASGATVAESTHGNVASFRDLFTPLTGAKGPFASVSLWSADALSGRPLATVGQPPEIAQEPAGQLTAFLQHATTIRQFAVLNLLAEPQRRLGYAMTAPSPTVHYVIYAEQPQPQSGRVPIASDTAFSDLGYALYLGHAQSDASLIYADAADRLPLRGRHSTDRVPFGDSNILLVMSPHKALGGALMQRLPWALTVGGIALTLLTALLVERLARRRKDAEALAGELNVVAAQNAELYEQQRDVAETLQHSLLPETIPAFPGLTIAGRFAAGTPGIEIGGDWYDVIDIGRQRCAFVVGDVSGRGVRAGTIMAKLRYAVRAYAVAGDAPDEILDKLSKLLTIRDGHFATVLCGEFDLEARQIRYANAGHLPPVVRTGDDVRLIEGHAGVPIGVTRRTPYPLTTIDLADEGTFLIFTDGLVERRGESIDVGLGRVVDITRRNQSTLDALLDEILGALQYGADDDTAMLGLKWHL